MVNRRRNEIGIRMALGASRRPVLWLVLREVGLLVGAGLVLGTGAALATTKFVRGMLFGVAAKDAGTIVVAAVGGTDRGDGGIFAGQPGGED